MVHEDADTLYGKMVNRELSGEPPDIQKALYRALENTEVIKGQLFKYIDGHRLLFPKPSERTQVVLNAHKIVGHGGVKKTLEQLKIDYYWESMAFDVAETLACCAECQVNKPFKPAKTYRLVSPKFAWHTVLIDVMGPLAASSGNTKYIIVAIDHLTRWVETRALAKVDAFSTAKFILEQIIHRHGCPQVILTDNGTNFTANVIPKLNDLMGIRGALSTPYHPETNGMVERVNATLAGTIRKLVAGKTSQWNQYLSSATFAYNIAYHSSTGVTPFELLYGRRPALPPILYSALEPTPAMTPQAYLQKLTDTLIGIQAQAFSSTLDKKIQAKKYHDLKREPLTEYEIGSKVAYCDTHGYGRHNKMDALWTGPHEVINKTSLDAYTIKNLGDGRLTNKVHAKYLRLWKELPIGPNPL